MFFKKWVYYFLIMTPYASGSLFNLETHIFYNIKYVYYDYQKLEGQEVGRDNILKNSHPFSTSPGTTINHFLNH